MIARRTAGRMLAALSFVLFASTVTAAVIAPTATAAPVEATSWGPDGSFLSDTAVTVRWDNTGNAPENTVPRDANQVLAHTAGKTYLDLKSGVRSAYARLFGNLEITVSHTQNLINQTVDIRATGALEGHADGDGTFLEVYQCWGAPLPDGTPDPEATNPDPATCEGGVAADDVNGSYFASGDADLVVGGDWEGLAWQRDEEGNPSPNPVQGEIPFRAIDGTVLPVRTSNNPYFSKLTTNELSGISAFRFSPLGEAARPFELQTGSEAGGLGCGYRSDAASSSRCWLVLVPQTNVPGAAGILSQTSSLSPSLWANRLQVRLGMGDVSTRCSGGDARTLLAGSELLAGAMASWIPGACNTLDTAVGYTLLGDTQVRRELDAGTRDHAMLSVPGSAESIDTPLAIAGTVIGYRLDDSHLKAPAVALKLNARLVAKLLTETYIGATDNIINTQLGTLAPWMTEADFYRGLSFDPEFLRLNPQISAVANDTPDVIASITQSDAAAQVWSWLLGDLKARSFLHGCPDDDGRVINPFFSTRSYDECLYDARSLDAKAAERIDQTTSPANYVYTPAVYPPDTAMFPQPGWYERAAVGEPDPQGVLTLTDLHPRLTGLADIGRTVNRTIYPAINEWCRAKQDTTCGPGIGKWKSIAAPQYYGNRGILGLTDTVTAARYQLPTALLCGPDDPTGEHCVGATVESLTAAADRFEVDVKGVPATGAPDYEGGAYPMTLPVYGSVATKNLQADEAQALAGLFGYFSTDGQVVGYESGQLPPGYAPLTPDLQDMASDSLSRLAAWVPPAVKTPTTKPAAVPPTSFVPRTTPRSTPGPTAPTTPAATIEPEAVAQVGTTPSTEIGFPQFGLAGGLLAAIATGIASPIVGGNRRVRR